MHGIHNTLYTHVDITREYFDIYQNNNIIHLNILPIYDILLILLT